MRKIIIGPPGTGKTTRIVSLVHDMIKSGISQKKIGLVAFTKVAAKVLASRANISTKYIGTLHSLAFRTVGLSREQIIDFNIYNEFSRLVQIPLSNRNIEDNDQIKEGDEYLGLYQYHRATCGTSLHQTYQNSHRPGNYKLFKYFVESLDAYKKSECVLDFNDILEKAMQHPAPDLDVLFIDEAQDLSPLQWGLVNYWIKKIPNALAIGDDDQAIFSWGGADPRGILKWAEFHGAEKEILTQSYRVPPKIHAIADKLIDRVADRIDKKYLPRTGGEGTVIYSNSTDTLDFTHGEDCVILYRNHALRKDIENHIIELGVPYQTLNGLPGAYGSKFYKALILWQKTVINLERLGNLKLTEKDLKTLKPFIYATALDIVKKNGYSELKEKGYLDWKKACIPNREKEINYLKKVELKYGLIPDKPTIRFSTIHGFKGAEAERVVLIDGMGQRTNQKFNFDPDSEYRVFYVGVTRARERLDVVMTSSTIGISK